MIRHVIMLVHDSILFLPCLYFVGKFNDHYYGTVKVGWFSDVGYLKKMLNRSESGWLCSVGHYVVRDSTHLNGCSPWVHTALHAPKLPVWALRPPAPLPVQSLNQQAGIRAGSQTTRWAEGCAQVCMERGHRSDGWACGSRGSSGKISNRRRDKNKERERVTGEDVQAT